MIQFKQQLAQKVKEPPFRATPDGQVNVRSISNFSGSERTEEENVGTPSLFEYFYGSADVSLVGLRELNFFFHLHWFQALVHILRMAANSFSDALD